MSDQSQRTEKATPRRVQKAREDGKFPNSRSLTTGLQFTGFVALLSFTASSWFSELQKVATVLFSRAIGPEIGHNEILLLIQESMWRAFYPLVVGGGLLTALTLMGQLLVTNFGFNLKGLTLNFDRLNPIPRLGAHWNQSVMNLLQAMVMIPLFLYVAYRLGREQMDTFFSLPFTGVLTGFARVAQTFDDLLWKAAGVFMLFGIVDFIRERQRYFKSLRMSQHEIRQEHKESEGSPHVKGRIRRLQRSFARRRMMKDVPLATAIVVNPTHYAVALRYDTDLNSAPMVLAKGKNYLARRIREIATEHQIPIVENPPLAQALYKSVDVGQEIPADLYRAVAEVLAYVYKLAGTNRPR